jgi:hypothetical protein
MRRIETGFPLSTDRNALGGIHYRMQTNIEP